MSGKINGYRWLVGLVVYIGAIVIGAWTLFSYSPVVNLIPQYLRAILYYYVIIISKHFDHKMETREWGIMSFWEMIFWWIGVPVILALIFIFIIR